MTLPQLGSCIAYLLEKRSCKDFAYTTLIIIHSMLHAALGFVEEELDRRETEKQKNKRSTLRIVK